MIVIRFYTVPLKMLVIRFNIVLFFYEYTASIFYHVIGELSTVI